jgi:hypothetical protein
MSRIVTIFVALLGDGQFVVNGPVPDDEQWEFEPGSCVLCETRVFQDGAEGLVATKRISA